MNDYISYQEALELMDMQRINEVWKKDRGGAARKRSLLLGRAIQHRLIFSIIDTEGGGLLVQKDSVSKFFGNWGKLRDDIAFQRDELLTDELEHWVAFESIEYKHLCGLNLREHFEGIYGNIIIDGIYIHYYISAEAGTIGILKASLESEGTYSILTEMASALKLVLMSK